MSHLVLFYRKRIKLPWTTPTPNAILSYYLSMNDLTSGFNIGTNYTLNPQFNEMTGFTEKRCTGYAGVLLHNMPIQSFGRRVDRTDCFFYFGMLTISGMHKGETKLTIPNQVVREQLFAYILDTYHENDLTFDSYEKRKFLLARAGWFMMANGNLTLNTLPDACTVMPRKQDKQKGEYFVHGFTLCHDRTKSFLSSCVRERQSGRIRQPVLASVIDIYKDMSHSYIIELKYAKGKDSSERIEQLRRQAIEKLNATLRASLCRKR